MSNLTSNQSYARLKELAELARERYVAAGGAHGSASGDKHLTSDERQEFLDIARTLRQKGVSLSNSKST